MAPQMAFRKAEGLKVEEGAQREQATSILLQLQSWLGWGEADMRVKKLLLML